MIKSNMVFISLFLCVSQVKADISANDTSYAGWVQKKESPESISISEAREFIGKDTNYTFNDSVMSSLELSKEAEPEELIVMVIKSKR
ncbi:hypothetical protein [Photobacterium satsumensis]|uniref:hypothetical protein n=1 Tax=Photobacterium satsumensis TaxID=2910239 RepID=UPI003D14911F